MSTKQFAAGLNRLAKRMGLVLNVKEMEVVRGKSSGSERSAIITASGADQTGILYRLSSVLAKLKVNISDLTSRQIPSPQKQTLYVVMIEVTLPKGLSLENLRGALNRIAAPMHLDVSVREISVEQL
jgi:glycine cleavage system regulatory protein